MRYSVTDIFIIVNGWTRERLTGDVYTDRAEAEGVVAALQHRDNPGGMLPACVTTIADMNRDDDRALVIEGLPYVPLSGHPDFPPNAHVFMDGAKRIGILCDGGWIGINEQNVAQFDCAPYAG